MSDVIDDVVRANAQFAAAGGGRAADGRPARALALVACMDARIDLLPALGLEVGDAHVLRNAGGVVSDDVIRSLAISQRKLGTRSVMLIHHTKCGMSTLTEDAFRAELLADTGMTPNFAIESFADPAEDVRQSIRRVRSSPFLPHRDDVRGFVYDVDTHRLTEVSSYETLTPVSPSPSTG